MPTLLDYRRRIRSVKSTKQITRAMKFVAAAKLRRAQEGVYAARPYAKEILRVLRSAAARMETPARRKDFSDGPDRRPQPRGGLQFQRAAPYLDIYSRAQRQEAGIPGGRQERPRKPEEARLQICW